MKFSEYSEVADSTAIYPHAGEIGGLCYAALGLNGEAGEVAEKVKKLLRDKGGVVDDQFRKEVAKEIGDVLWYMNALCKELDIKLEDAAQGNLDKLLSRKARGVLGGSGDNR